MRTPLFSYHQSHARLTTFHGWEMPLLYAGILDEHAMVRNRAGLFDVSHMGKLLLTAEPDTLQRAIPSRLPAQEGRCRYTHLLDEQGRILDDVIITRVARDRYLLVCNAGPRKRVVEWSGSHFGPQAVRDRTGELVCLALQGPRAPGVLQPFIDADLGDLKAFRGRTTHLTSPPVEMEGWAPLHTHLGVETDPESEDRDALYLTRTGYTGEDGFEIFAGNDLGSHLWRRLLRETDSGPAGLGARDTLRLEQGYLLSGQDFDGRQTPLEVGYERIIDWDHDFPGREALRRQKEAGGFQQLRGLRLRDSGVPRNGQRVWRSGRKVGRVTSGTHSPSLEVGIALAYLEPQVGDAGMRVQVDIRGRRAEAEVVSTPFL